MSERYPRDPREIIRVPLAVISRERQPWHVRVVTREADVRRLAALIQMTGVIEPITIVPSADGGYLVGLGLMRLLAAEYLGLEAIPAYVLAEADAPGLIRRAIADEDGNSPYSTLERGWALLRLEEALEAEGLPCRQKDIVVRQGLDKGTVSGSLKAGRAITEQRLRELASQRRLDWKSLISLPREAVRQIANAPEKYRDELLHAVAGAVEQGSNATSAVKEKRASLLAGEVSNSDRHQLGLRRLRSRLYATLVRALRVGMRLLRRLLPYIVIPVRKNPVVD